MKNINKRKFTVMISLSMVMGCLVIAFQNFTGSEGADSRTKSLSDAMSAAISMAEQDHNASRMALNVDSEHIEKASFRKNQSQKVIVVGNEVTLDKDVGVGRPSHEENVDELDLELEEPDSSY